MIKNGWLLRLQLPQARHLRPISQVIKETPSCHCQQDRANRDYDKNQAHDFVFPAASFDQVEARRLLDREVSFIEEIVFRIRCFRHFGCAGFRLWVCRLRRLGWCGLRVGIMWRWCLLR